MIPVKSIFEYENYRNFLNDFYIASKAKNKNFSLRFFSRAAGFKTPGILKRVISGEINLSIEGVAKFSKALKLNKEESIFFQNLVLFNQAASSSEKSIYFAEILKCRSYRKLNPLKEFQLAYFSKWYFVAIREMVGLKNFKEDSKWISKALRPPIEPHKVEAAVNELLKLGLIARGEDGSLVQTEKNIGAFDELISSSMVLYHKEMMTRASESIDLFKRDKRQIDGATFKTSTETIKKIKEMIEGFREQVREEAAKADDQDVVCQLNLQFFPLAEVPSGEDE